MQIKIKTLTIALALLACSPAVTATALTDTEILARLEALEKENADIKAQLKKSSDIFQNGELRIFHTDECPIGWVEFNLTQGHLMLPRPNGGKVGTTLNRPMEAGEKSRLQEHSHSVGVEDLGHTHTTIVNDPGHSHPMLGAFWNDEPQTHRYTGPGPFHGPDFSVEKTTTGITVEAQPAKSNMSAPSAGWSST